MLVDPSGRHVTSNPPLQKSQLSDCGDCELRELVLYPDKRLKRRALDVVVFDDSLRKLVGDLAFTMYSMRGAGLAATQIDEPRRVLVIDILNGTKGNQAQLVVMVNPVIGWLSDEMASDHEGCLSFPMLRSIVPRHVACVVEGQGIDGEWWALNAEGDLARAVQHEVDHLNGVTFLQRMGKESRAKAITMLNQFAGMIQKDMNRSDTAAKEAKALKAKQAAEAEEAEEEAEGSAVPDLEGDEPRGELEDAAVVDDQGFKKPKRRHRKVKVKRGGRRRRR